MHYLLFYSLAPDYLARRPEFRAQHLALAWAAADRGELLNAGAVSDPPNPDPYIALFLFSADSPAPAESFAKSDPYVLNGLVTRWYVRLWTTVAGPLAVTPVHPS